MPVANWELLLIKAAIHPSYALRTHRDGGKAIPYAPDNVPPEICGHIPPDSRAYQEWSRSQACQEQEYKPLG